MNKAIPEKQLVRIGFNPLTDCASVVMAAVLGFDEKYGIKIVPCKETSWAVVRDKLLTGELDAAHSLYGMVYGTQLGVGLHKRDMAVLMGLNRNGQGIALTRRLAEQGATDGASLAALMRSEPRQYTFAHTFPTGTHAMWLCYWLAAHGVDPMRDARLITVPPSQMVQYMAEGHMDGFCAGDPWGHRAVMDGIGVAVASTDQIWPEHPEKVLAASAEFVRHHPNTCRAVIAAVLEASRWIDAAGANRMAMAEILSGQAYLDTSKEAITQRSAGAHPLRFHHEGAVNFPYLSDGMWFMTQQRRWGLLKADPDYLAVAQEVHQLALYKEAADMTGTPVPSHPMRRSVLMDGQTWDGSDPGRYAASFSIRQ